MASVSARFDKRIGDAQEQLESWKERHIEAMQVYDVQDRISNFLSLFELIDDVDTEYHTEMFRAGNDLAPEFESKLKQLYAVWYEKAIPGLEYIDGLQSAGHTLDHVQEFIDAVNEVKGILTADGEFFEYQELAPFAEAAIENFRAGQCETFDDWEE